MKAFVSGLVAVALAASISVGIGVSRADEAGAKDNYKNLCVKCHGEAGKGDGPGVAKLQKKPGSFSDCARMAKFDDDTLFKIIKEGGPAGNESKEMTAFSDGMEDGEIKDMVSYVRTFCKK
jgi:high-affinity iron transporter